MIIWIIWEMEKLAIIVRGMKDTMHLKRLS